MARTIEKLSAIQVGRIKDTGMHADGGGLYLQVSGTGTKSWIFRFMLDGHAREMGLGPLHTVSLAEARVRATDCRQLVKDGKDPIQVRDAEKAKARLEAARSITFKAAADEYIKAQRPGWRNAKHAAQWENTLRTYAYPVIGAVPVQAIDTGLVIRILQPLWSKKPETASRLRGRMEAILDCAKVLGYREGENPARWRGHLDKRLPKPSKVRKVRHHAALAYEDLPDFLALLRNQGGTSARALEFAILTAARTGEVIGARWGEIDLNGKVWIVPAERMKAEREHRVPLSPRAVDILNSMRNLIGDKYPADAFVFPGGQSGRPLSDMALLMLLRRMGRDDLTVHGFRSTFRDWAAETTGFPAEVVEMALAHAIADKVEAAYRRGVLFEKRRRLMDAWAGYAGTPKKAGNVVPISQAL